MADNLMYVVDEDGKKDDLAVMKEMLEIKTEDELELAEVAVRRAMAGGMTEWLARQMYGVQ